MALVTVIYYFDMKTHTYISQHGSIIQLRPTMNENNPIQTYSTVQRWLANIPNHNTQKFYLYSLRKYVNQTNTNPDNLISIGQKNGEDAHDQLKTFYNYYN